MVEYTKKELYGGGISVEIPKNLLDASEFRQVPDTQEVFLNSSENVTNLKELNKNDSIIFDLMEKLDVEDSEALKEHLGEISALNDAENNWKLLDLEEVNNQIVNSQSYIGIGLEPALKWGRDETVKSSKFKQTLVVVLGLIRLERVQTDVLISFNVLFEDDLELSDLQKLHDNGYKHDETNKAFKRISLGVEVVKNAISTFKVENYYLFR